MATKTESIPRGLQILALCALGGSLVLQWALTFSTVIQQMQYNANLSSYVAFFISSVVVPVVFFAGAYVLNPRKLSRLGRLFESMIILLVGQIAVQLAVQAVLLMLQVIMPNQAADVYWNFIAYDIGATIVTTVLFFGVLVYLRKTKRWK